MDAVAADVTPQSGDSTDDHADLGAGGAGLSGVPVAVVEGRPTRPDVLRTVLCSAEADVHVLLVPPGSLL